MFLIFRLTDFLPLLPGFHDDDEDPICEDYVITEAGQDKISLLDADISVVSGPVPPKKRRRTATELAHVEAEILDADVKRSGSRQPYASE